MEDDMAANRKATQARAGAKKDRNLDHDALIRAALAMIAARGWRATSLADLAAETGHDLADILGIVESKAGVLRGFVRMIDRAALASPPDAEGSIRDKLFELLMRRFDALAPYRDAVQRLARDLLGDPPAAACAAMQVAGAMRATAELAGVETGGLLGAARVKLIGAAYAWAMRTWLTGDAADNDKTMKALDQALTRLETLARSVPGTKRAA
jgi:AcrR family transcriptional regulator